MRLRKRRVCILIVSIISIFCYIDHVLLSSRKEFSNESINSDHTNLYQKLWIEYGKKDVNEKQSYTEMEFHLNNLNDKKSGQSNEELIQIIKKYWLYKPSLKNYSLENSQLSDFSMGQSEIVDKLLKNKERGFFVECGALDGETRSNSLFFERDRYWEGLLIEASLSNFKDLLQKHRKAYAVPACLGIHTYPETMKFNEAKNRGRVIEDSAAFNWISEQGLEPLLSTVQCFPLYSLLLALGRTHIDYLSLDVEGLELDILRTIPWDKVHISVITVEFLHDKEGKETLLKYVQNKGYKLVTELTADKNWANDFVFIKRSLIT